MQFAVEPSINRKLNRANLEAFPVISATAGIHYYRCGGRIPALCYAAAGIRCSSITIINIFHRSNFLGGIVQKALATVALVVLSFVSWNSAWHVYGGDWKRVYQNVTDHQLNDIWCFGENKVMAVGDKSEILQWDGSGWSRLNRENVGDMRSIWGTQENDVFISDKYLGYIYQYDGRDLTIDIAGGWPSFLDIWGSSRENVFFVGSRRPFIGGGGNDDTRIGTAIRYDGKSLWGMDVGAVGELAGVWGSSSEDVFAVGEAGVILNYNGQKWEAMESPVEVRLNGIWGSAGDDVFAVGKNGTILHYDGTAWTAMQSGTTLDFNAVWGAGRNEFYAVGDRGLVLHYDGTAWSEISIGTSLPLISISGSSPQNIFVLGTGSTIFHYDGSNWKEITNGTTNHLNGIWSDGRGEVFVVGENGDALHFDGVNWRKLISGTSVHLKDIWGSERSDVFSVGENGTILHFDGSGWSDMESSTTTGLEGVWGSGEADVFAVGEHGAILHFDGVAWTPMNSGTGENLYAIWGTAPDNVYAIGHQGLIFHYNGISWELSAFMDTYGPLRAIWGSGENDIFAVTQYGRIFHYNGGAWSEMLDISGKDLFGVWGNSENNVYSCGSYNILKHYNSVIYHYDGSIWHEIATDEFQVLKDISGSDGTNVFAVGEAGIILHFKLNPPQKPTLLTPSDSAAKIALRPTFAAGPFSDSDSSDTHSKTEWQVSTQPGFETLVFHKVTSDHLTTLSLPGLVLDEGMTYFWRVRYYDSHPSASAWADAFSLTTVDTNSDADGDGVADGQRVADTDDVDRDGTFDNFQPGIKSLNTATENRQLGISIISDSNGAAVDRIWSVDPNSESKVAKIHRMPFDVLALRITTGEPGDMVPITVYLSEAAPLGSRWYFYDALDGWQDYSSYADFSEDLLSLDLWLEDGGIGDVDGTANGVIVTAGAVCQESVNAFVTRLYQLCLGREPEPAGLAYWVEALLGGSKSAVEVAYGFVFSAEFMNKDTSDADYLAVMYRAFFDRAPDTDGLADWLSRMKAGLSRADTLNGFVFSAEYAQLVQDYKIEPNLEAFVRRFYRECLDREPDLTGLHYWVDALQNRSKAGADIARGFIMSPEFGNRGIEDDHFMEILYRAFFGRPPDAAGLSHWLAELEQGKDRGDVLDGFIYSDEFRALCNTFGISAY